MLNFPSINPVVFSLGSLQVRWYSIAYIVGIMYCNWWVLRCNKKLHLSKNPQAFNNFIIYLVLGVVLGGRLGYALLYQTQYYLEHPAEVLKTWLGGMSFHGGLVGVGVAMVLLCKIHKVSFLRLADVMSLAAPVGLFFGRIANFINAELWGRPSNMPFAVLFPTADDTPRHPSQLYEAVLEGLVLFAVLNALYKFTKISVKKGATFGLFLALYACARIFCEMFREPDVQLGFFFNLNVTMGQILSVPMLAAGCIIFYIANSKEAKA